MKFKRSVTDESQKRTNLLNENNPHLKRTEEISLNHSLLQLQVHEKQDEVRQVFNKNQKSLCNYFIRYQPHLLSKLNMRQVMEKEVRLIKNTNKIYFGGFRHNMREGSGILISPQGKIYEGTFENNIRQGYGLEIYPNGNLYFGDFHQNKKHGKGQFYWFSFENKKFLKDYTEYYEGKWWGGLPDGRGSLQKITGDIYDGEFKNGLKHGRGEEYFNNGDSYKGDYINGLPQGFGHYFWLDGSHYQGEFKQGIRNGKGIWISADGSETYKGRYEGDKKSGLGEFSWKKGRFVYKGKFQNDVRHGYGELLKLNKLEYAGEWVNGKRVEELLVKIVPEKQKQSQSFLCSSSKVLSKTMKLKPPSSAIIRRLEVYDTGIQVSSFVRSKSPNNKTPLIFSDKFEKKKHAEQTTSSEKSSSNKKRPASHHNRTYQKKQHEPTYELLVKQCNKRNCGCNLTIPLKNGLQLRQKSSHLKTETKFDKYY